MLSLWVGQGHEKKGKDQPLLGLLVPPASSAIFPQTLMFHASSTGNVGQGVPAGTRSRGRAGAVQAVLLSRALSARNGKCGARGMCRGIPAVLLRTTGRDLPWLCVR